MKIDRSKLKKIDKVLTVGEILYEINGGMIIYEVDKTYNKEEHEFSIPLIVVNDYNGYFKTNTLVQRQISKLLYL